MSPIPLAGRRLALLAALFAVALPAAAQPGTYASGLAVSLPEDWSGPAEVDESRYPDLATYRFENANPASPLRGAVLHVERLTGLNPVMRERWMQGRVPYGYHGARPVGALSGLPFPGAVGFRTERGGATGHVFFLVRGPVYWAVQVEAPEAVFAAQEQALIDLVRTLRFAGE